ncbi:hypothetical protein J7E25_02390 [Agromyces sp. ISL-38]|uniref:hypothetical protein n=1 Tax=Agromyces sp. ISL-38 TaxID=2819107 RepID=UPI001BE71F31|nr:hypothetical protein [Agromyces sp. ISL-38]MBT2497936.1 hypothetical protein [Agromyces sp. ISL-38]
MAELEPAKASELISADIAALHPDVRDVLESAARLQELVPDAVLVGGSAAAIYAQHRASYDHDHVLVDLRDRFDVVLEALESEGGFVTNRLTPGKIILGELGGIETGIRQLIRTRPLETQRVTLPSGRSLTVPTMAETLRVKGFLIVRRNQTRDVIDVVALASRYGLDRAAEVLARIDDAYRDDTGPADERPVRDQLVRQLADPQPRDLRTTRRLADYKGLQPRWHDWSTVVDTAQSLARAIYDVEKER